MPNELRPADVASSPRPAESPKDGLEACPTDLSIQCPQCTTQMQPEHAHYRCLTCGYRDSCCM